MPAVAATVSVAVEDTSWIGVGQYLFVVTAGVMDVTAVADANTLTLRNTGAAINAVATTSISLGKKVSPGGAEGPSSISGQAAGGDLKGTYLDPTLAIPVTRGDILSGNNTNRTLLSVGATGKTLHADSSEPTGLIWETVDLGDVTHVTGVVPIANGGTGQAAKTASFDALSPTTIKGDLVASDGLDNVRVPVGTNGQVLVSDSTIAHGVKWETKRGSYIQCRHREDPGVDGGAIATGIGWTTVILTDKNHDDDAIATFSGVNDSITVPAGTYRFRYQFIIVDATGSTGAAVSWTRGRLAVFGGAAIADTESITNPFMDAKTDGKSQMQVVQREGKFTVAAPTEIVMQCYKPVTTSTQWHFGQKTVNPGGVLDEIYATLTLEKE